MCRKEERALYRETIRGMSALMLKGFNESYSPERIFAGLVLRDRAAKRGASSPN
jgi:hypothetical protein